MSYDVFFKLQKKELVPDCMTYFSSRPNYKVSDTQAWYENEATGVYFSFMVGKDYDIEFNINYFRPHYFALEAKEELLAFCMNFPSTIIDPQRESRSKKFDGEMFLKSWQENNQLASQVLKSKSTLEEYKLVPTELLTQFWEWNYNIDKLHSGTLSHRDVFIPKLMLYEEEKHIQLLSLWPEGLPVVLPRNVDIIIARKQWLRKKLSIIKYQIASRLLEKYEAEESNGKYVVLNYKDMPKDIKNFFKSSYPTNLNRECFLDRNFVINRELF